MFETISAPTGADNLLLKSVKVETHASAKQYVEVFKRDMRRMGLNKSRQRLKRRVVAAGPGNAFEIGVEIYGGGHGDHPSGR